MRVLNFVFNRSKCRGRARFVCCCVILRRCMALLVGCGVALLPARCVALLPARRVALLPARPVDLRAWGEGVVEYPGKVACPSGRRCSTRNAVWCHSHPGFKSQRYRHCRPAPLGPGGFVMPSWRAVWPHGCSGCRRPRPPVRLGPHFVRRRASKPARALRTLRRPPHQWGRVADRCVVSIPGQAPLLPINFARNSPAACSNIEFASLELQRFWGVSKNDHDKLRAKFGRRWCRCCPRAPRQVSAVPSTPVGPGVLMGNALEGLRLHARKSSPCLV